MPYEKLIIEMNECVVWISERRDTVSWEQVVSENPKLN